jgi:site-specific recombinase
MSWSAIIGGWLVATGIASLMYVAGLALGFAAFDPYDAAATAKGIGIATAVWVVLSWTVSLFLGGMFASWFDGNRDQTVVLRHHV